MDSDLDFKEWLGEDRWKALKHAFKKGKKAYTKKRTEQKKKPEPEKITVPAENLHKWLTERRVAFLKLMQERNQS